MNKRIGFCMTAATLMMSGGVATAEEVRVRFVERVGNVDMVLAGNVVPQDGQIHRIRVQFGIFDNAQGPARAGGFIGWIDGVQDHHVIRGTRTPGRLGIYTFGEPGQDGNGMPVSDPFTHLTNIDAVMGPQQLEWRCEKGDPLPMPSPVIRGRNTFVSVWEVTMDASMCSTVMTVSGDVLLASSWQLVGTPMAPVCGGLPDVTPVTYAPAGVTRVPFEATLSWLVGPPGPNPPCPGDWNFDWVVNSQDFFDFLAAFFDRGVDINCDGASNSEDYFEFLRVFFGGC